MWVTARSKLETGHGWSHRADVALWAHRQVGAPGSSGLDLPRESPLCSAGTLAAHEPHVVALSDMPLLIFVLFCFGIFFT